MNYTEMLNKLINESGLNQKEICNRCAEFGEEVTTTYLSALKNTNGKTASENVSRVIAKACNAKHDEILVVQTYLDKAPRVIIEFLEEVKDLNSQSNSVAEIIYKGLPQNLSGIADAKEKSQNIKSLAEFICEYKGKLRAPDNEFNLMMNALKSEEIDIGARVRKKLEEDESWLLIPLGDMAKSKIVTKAEADYIKNNLL